MEVINLLPFGVMVKMTGQAELMQFRQEIFDLAHLNSFVVVRGLTAVLSDDDFVTFSLDHGRNKVIKFNDRTIIDIKYQPDSPNYLLSTEKVPYHFDGAFHEMPRYLVWNCVSTNGKPGGETTFVNGEHLAERLDELGIDSSDHITITYHTEKLAHYGGGATVALKERHPYKDRQVLRYAEPVNTQKNPLSLHVQNVESQDAFVMKMQELLYSNNHTMTHRWELGDVVIADNYSLLHGRLPLSDNVSRHIRRLHVS